MYLIYRTYMGVIYRLLDSIDWYRLDTYDHFKQTFDPQRPFESNV